MTTNISLNDYLSKSKDLPYIEPLEKCCSEPMELVEVEPLEGRDTLKVARTCIVKCPLCSKLYQSKWD